MWFFFFHCSESLTSLFFIIFFQCCLTWLLAYPALEIVTLVLPIHSRFKVSNMERLQWNNVAKCILRDWENVVIVMEVNNKQNPVTRVTRHSL